MKLQSYLMGEWREGQGEGVPVRDASTGEVLARVTAEGLPVKEAVAWGREVGGKALLALGFQERGRRLRALAQYLSERKEALYRLYATTGGTRRDAWYDVDGGIGVLYAYSSLARNLPEGNLLPEDDFLPLSKDLSFQGRHVLAPKGGSPSRSTPSTSPYGGSWRSSPPPSSRGPHPGEARHPHGPRGRGPGADDAGVGPPPGREPPAPRGKRGGPL